MFLLVLECLRSGRKQDDGEQGRSNRTFQSKDKINYILFVNTGHLQGPVLGNKNKVWEKLS